MLVYHDQVVVNSAVRLFSGRDWPPQLVYAQTATAIVSHSLYSLGIRGISCKPMESVSHSVSLQTKRTGRKAANERGSLFKLGYGDLSRVRCQVDPSCGCNVFLNFMRLLWWIGEHDAVDVMAVLNVLYHQLLCKWQGSSIRRCVLKPARHN